MITLEKLLNHLQPSSLNEIVAGFTRDAGGSAGVPAAGVSKTRKTKKTKKTVKTLKTNKSNKSQKR